MNEALPEDIGCIDIEDPSKGRPSDDQVWLMIRKLTGATHATAFQQLPEETKKQAFRELKGHRASLRQLSRLTGIGKGVIHRIWNTTD